MKVINFFAGPGAGKSTLAAGLFYEMKHRGYNVELVTEYAKDKVWEESTKTLDDQVYVFAKQLHRQRILEGKVEYVITDSPLLLTLIYGRYSRPLRELVAITFDEFENTNVFVKRTKEYVTAGRMQSKEEAEVIDNKILCILEGLRIPFITFDQHRADDCIVRLLEQLALNRCPA